MKKKPPRGKRPVVFEYHEYRKFLKDWFKFLEATGKKISLRKFSKKAGLATCYLSHVLGGSIPLSEKAFQKMAPHLELDSGEEMYLGLLRTVGESLDPDTRWKAFKRIQKILGARGIHPEEIGSYRYLTRWYYVAIREMVDMDGFRLDPRWIRKRLKHDVSLREIGFAIDFLVKNGFIDNSDPDRPKIAERALDFNEGFSHIALHEFYQQMNGLGMQSLSTIPRSERKIVSHNIAIPYEKLDEIREILDEAFKKVNRLTKNYKKRDSVYHIGLSAFPLAREPIGGGKKS